MECVESGRRREDVAPVHWRVHQAGVHRWRPGLATELQRPVRPDEMVIAAQEVDGPVELVGATGGAGRATAHVRRAWANREVETLDERGVQGLGILRLPPRSLQPTRRADPPAPFDSDAAIVPPRLEHVTLAARGKSRRCIRPALHPGCRRSSSVKYYRYVPPSRLGSRTHHRSRCDAGLSPRAARRTPTQRGAHSPQRRTRTHRSRSAGIPPRVRGG